MKILEIAGKKRYFLIFMLLIVAVFSVRLIHLDQDMPDINVSFYNPGDEGIYNTTAINTIAYGTKDPSEGEFPYYTADSVKLNLINHYVTVLSMKLFGDNFWGLRMPAILYSALSLLLLCLSMDCLCKENHVEVEKKRGAILLASAVFTLSFQYMLASRTNEPSTLRMLFTLLTIYAFFKLNHRPLLKYSVCMLIATISIFQVYVTNLFLYLALGVTLLFDLSWNGRENNVWKQIGTFLLSIAIGFIITDILFRAVWNESVLPIVIRTISSFTGQSLYSVSTTNQFLSPLFYMKRLLVMFSSNIGLYHLPLLFILLLVFPRILVIGFKRRDMNAVMLMSMLGAFFAQTVVSEDYVIRKFIVVYPVLFFLMALAWLYSADWQNFKNQLAERHPVAVRATKVVYILFSTLFILLVVYKRLFTTANPVNGNLNMFAKLIVLMFGLLPILFVAFVLCLRQVNSSVYQSRKVIETSLIVLLACNFLLNAALIGKYILLNPTYKDKEMMIELGELADGKYVYGCYAVWASLYNDIIPVVSLNPALANYLDEHGITDDLVIFEASENLPNARSYIETEYLGEVGTASGKYSAKPFHIFDRNIMVGDVDLDFALYKPVFKQDLVREYREQFEIEEKEYLKEYEQWLINREGEAPKVPVAYYSDYYGDVYDANTTTYYTPIHGNIYGNIGKNIYGDIYGDVRGDIYGTVYGNIYGTVYGNVYGEIQGTVSGGIIGSGR